MSTVLYRKYRARRFSDVRGQEVVTTVLRNSIINGKISHAYLFAGPRGTGKTSMARLLAAAVNDPKFPQLEDIDLESEVSKSIEQGSYLDMVEIDAASNRGIEEIRQLREGVNYRPALGAYKVYIIDEVHMLTREAFNALLKTLEEPPTHAIFVLATTEPHKIPDTILSRVQRFDFRPATKDELSDKLGFILESEGYKFSKPALELLHQYSGGSFRDAESILGKILMGKKAGDQVDEQDVQDILGLAPAQIVQDFIQQTNSGNAIAAVGILGQLVAQGLSLERFISQVILELRLQITQRLETSQDFNRELNFLRKLIQTTSELRMVDDIQVLLELMIYELTGMVGKAVAAKLDAPKKEENLDLSKKIERKESIPKAEKAQPLNHTTAQKVLTDNSKLDNAKWKQLNDIVKSKDFKLWAHLKAVEYEVLESKLVIKSKYKQTITEINEADWFNQAVKSTFGDQFEVELNFDADSSSMISNETLVESMF